MQKLKYLTSLKNLLLIALIGGAFILRFLNLGYSDYQGDEFKAMFLPETGQSVGDFLLSQRKGPLQFLVTYVVQLIDYDYSNQFLSRVVFALAGFLAVYYFYKFARLVFSERISYIATFLFATNGFFVAFSRIVQYQSLVILFMVLALYVFAKAAYDKSYEIKGVYLGFIYWALSILAHYDGVFIAPFIAYLIFIWLQKRALHQFTSPRRLVALLAVRFKLLFIYKDLIFACLIFVLALCAFYIPFVLNIDSATESYWQGRLLGTGGKVSSSILLFRVYQPIYVIHIYALLFGLGVLKMVLNIVDISYFLMGIKKGIWSALRLILAFLDMQFLKYSALFLWFLLPFIFLEAIVDIPGTHIYTYLVPVFIICAFGIELLLDLARSFSIILRAPILNKLSYAIVAVLFSFIFLQSYFIYVDNYQEYPWEAERFFIWSFHQPSPAFHLSLFGFPYYRHWEEVSMFIEENTPVLPCPRYTNINGDPTCYKQDKVEYYSTNERDSIARNHIPYRKDTNLSGYYVYVINPQSFTNTLVQEKAKYWHENYDPIKTYYHNGKPITHIYYMPQGGLDVIKTLGY